MVLALLTVIQRVTCLYSDHYRQVLLYYHIRINDCFFQASILYIIISKSIIKVLCFQYIIVFSRLEIEREKGMNSAVCGCDIYINIIYMQFVRNIYISVVFLFLESNWGVSVHIESCIGSDACKSH